MTPIKVDTALALAILNEAIAIADTGSKLVSERGGERGDEPPIATGFTPQDVAALAQFRIDGQVAINAHEYAAKADEARIRDLTPHAEAFEALESLAKIATISISPCIVNAQRDPGFRAHARLHKSDETFEGKAATMYDAIAYLIETMHVALGAKQDEIEEAMAFLIPLETPGKAAES